jgi:hypothetical protein
MRAVLEEPANEVTRYDPIKLVSRMDAAPASAVRVPAGYPDERALNLIRRVSYTVGGKDEGGARLRLDAAHELNDGSAAAGPARRVPPPVAVELTQLGKSAVETAFRADMSLEAEYISKVSLRNRRALANLLRLLVLTMDGTQI